MWLIIKAGTLPDSDKNFTSLIMTSQSKSIYKSLRACFSSFFAKFLIHQLIFALFFCRKSAPQFLLDIYKKLSSKEEDENGNIRTKRDINDNEIYLSPEDQSAIDESDIIMTFLNKSKKGKTLKQRFNEFVSRSSHAWNETFTWQKTLVWHFRNRAGRVVDDGWTSNLPKFNLQQIWPSQGSDGESFQSWQEKWVRNFRKKIKISKI